MGWTPFGAVGRALRSSRPGLGLGLSLGLGLGFGFAIAPAGAEPLIYDFTVEVREGSLAGNRFSGTFRFDREAITGSGQETIGVADGLTVKMQFYGLDFAATQDVDYPQFPIVHLNNGEVEALDFWVEPSERGLWWERPGWEIELTRRGEAHH